MINLICCTRAGHVDGARRQVTKVRSKLDTYDGYDGRQDLKDIEVFQKWSLTPRKRHSKALLVK